MSWGGREWEEGREGGRERERVEEEGKDGEEGKDDRREGEVERGGEERWGWREGREGVEEERNVLGEIMFGISKQFFSFISHVTMTTWERYLNTFVTLNR